jgi:hypothetical protein
MRPPTTDVGPGCATPAERAPGASAAPINDGVRLANAMTELPQEP